MEGPIEHIGAEYLDLNEDEMKVIVGDRYSAGWYDRVAINYGGGGYARDEEIIELTVIEQ